ncbi:MAG: helix-turn-helix domain-containing protein [Sulfolobales archaeon]
MGDRELEAIRSFFSLNLYEAKAFIAVLRGARDAKEISRVAGIPYQRVYDVLRSLVSKGYIFEAEDGYRAYPPSVIIDKRVAEVREEYSRAVSRILGARDEVKQILERISSPASISTPSYQILRELPEILSAFIASLRGAGEAFMLIRKALRFREAFKEALLTIEPRPRIRSVVSCSEHLEEAEEELARSLGIGVKRSWGVAIDLMVTDTGYLFIGFPRSEDLLSKPLVIVVRDIDAASAALKELNEYYEELGDRC